MELERWQMRLGPMVRIIRYEGEDLWYSKNYIRRRYNVEISEGKVRSVFRG